MRPSYNFPVAPDTRGGDHPSYLDSARRLLEIKIKDAESGLTVSRDIRLAVVEPAKVKKPTASSIKILSRPTPQSLVEFLSSLRGYVAVDIETTGTDASDQPPESSHNLRDGVDGASIVGVGFSDGRTSGYVNLKGIGSEAEKILYSWILKPTDGVDGLVAHNLFFDGTWIARDTSRVLDLPIGESWSSAWTFDTYGLFRQLSSEGYPGQKWGLKDAQVSFLGWEDKGDVDLDNWLVDNGHFTAVSKEMKSGLVEVVNDKDEKRYLRPDKSKMHLAPANILGHYCALDAASTIQLLNEVFLPSIDGYGWADNFVDYHVNLFIDNVRLLGLQQLSGITIKRDEVEIHQTKLSSQVESHVAEFLGHPLVRPIADEFNRRAIEETVGKEPAKFKKTPKLAAEPTKFKKNGRPATAEQISAAKLFQEDLQLDGIYTKEAGGRASLEGKVEDGKFYEVSKTWERWNSRRLEIESRGPEVSKTWENWSAKMERVSSTEHLNPNSSAHLIELFYGLTPEGTKSNVGLGFEIKSWSKSGKPSTGANALPGLGEVGQLLKAQKDTVKELGYTTGLLNYLRVDAEGNSRLHPQFRVPGTLTGRLAGSGGVNLQQIPKSVDYLTPWRPVSGKVWIDCDHAALEQVVLAELSRDKSLLKLYGPGAPANDVYLFNAALMARDFGIKLFQPILDEGYDPEHPTPDAIARCKKKFKGLRAVSKVATLGKSYGMGGEKFMKNMELSGVELTWQEALDVAGGYLIPNREDRIKAYGTPFEGYVVGGLDKIYAGVKRFEKKLKEEWSENGGWILNGFNRPVGVFEDYLKDIVNRVVQSTGHDVHMLYLTTFSRLLDEAGIRWSGICVDFHDQSIIEVDEADAEKALDIIGRVAYDEMNAILGGLIPLKGDPQIIECMAMAKCEDYVPSAAFLERWKK